MFKKQPVLEPIKLKLKLPENGSYPPRIVMPSETLWLRVGSVKVAKLTFVEGSHNKWKLLADDKHKILVNGQEIVIDTVLADGDYIRQGTWKGIFQADPVADYRQALQKEKVDDVIEVNPSQMLRDWVRLDYDGISLDGGETFTRWDEIIRIRYSAEHGGWGIYVHTMTDKDKIKAIPSKLKKITSDDFGYLMFWIGRYIPFHLSMFSFSEYIWADAYEILAYDKLYIPAENNQRVLPEKAQKIFQQSETPKWEWLIIFVIFFGLLLILSIVLTKPNDFSLESATEVAFTFVFMLIFFAIMIGVAILERRYRQYKLNKLIEAEEASKKVD